MRWLVRHWLLLFNAGAVLFTVPVFLAPVLEAAGWHTAAAPIYFGYHFMCHQRPDRSFFIMGHQVAMCERNQSILLGFLGAGMTFNWVRNDLRSFSPLAVAVMMIPLAIDGTGQLFGLWESDVTRRTVTGALTGAGVGVFALVQLQDAFLSTGVGQVVTRQLIQGVGQQSQH
ncbi:MAG: DUF2085 domain-containing protein [Candidatus Dormibacteria bacterium]